MKDLSRCVAALVLGSLLLISPLALVVGCKAPSAQKIAVNSIISVDRAGIAAYDSYLTGVFKGSVPTNGVPVVSRQFNLFQDAVKAALDFANGNSNSIAPASLILDQKDLVTVITKNSKL